MLRCAQGQDVETVFALPSFWSQRKEGVNFISNEDPDCQ